MVGFILENVCKRLLSLAFSYIFADTVITPYFIVVLTYFVVAPGCFVLMITFWKDLLNSNRSSIDRIVMMYTEMHLLIWLYSDLHKMTFVPIFIVSTYTSVPV